MADVFSRAKRSLIMSRVKSSGNRATELKLIKIFREYGFKGWRRHSTIFGRPDFVFPTQRVAIFVDGCFWHGCPKHGQVPATNNRFWQEKLQRNKRRDRLVGKTLRSAGWLVLRIWQHEFRNIRRIVRRLETHLLSQPNKRGRLIPQLRMSAHQS